MTGEDRHEAQGDERSSSSGRTIAARRWGGRGAGAVMATGSYEESLLAEGIPDHHEASPFTGRRGRWSRRSPHPPTRTTPLTRNVRPDCSPHEGGGGARMNGGSRQGCQRFGRHRRRGKTTPTLVTYEDSCRMTTRRSGLGRRETSGPPVCRAEPWTPQGTPPRKWREELGTHEVRVHAVRLGGIRRLSASRVFFTGRLQGLLVVQEGASREEVRSAVWRGARMGRWRNGAHAWGQRPCPHVWPAGFDSQVSSTTEGASGLLPVMLSPAGRSKVLWPSGQLRIGLRWPRGQRVDDGQRIGRTKESDSGVPAGDDGSVRDRHGSVKALQGPRRSAGSPHPRRSKWRRSQRCAASCSVEADDGE